MKTAIVFASLLVSAGASAERNVAIVVHQGVELLDFAGPGEVFSAAGNGAFHVFTVGRSAEPIVSQGFVKIIPDYTIDTSPKPDIIVIPGGATNVLYEDPKMMAWLKKSAAEAEITMSVCNGAITLARTGLLDGLKATSHFSAIPGLRKFPKITVLPDERFVDNGRIIATQGVSAGIDGALHVVQRLLGDEAAWADARYMMYHWEPPNLSKPAKDELRPWIEQDWKTVEHIYQRKVASNPKDAVAMSRLGIALQELGQHERAVTTLTQAAALGSRDPNTFDDLGDARFALGQYEASARAYEQELPLLTAHMQPYLQLKVARAWTRAHNPDAALAALDQVVASGQISRKRIEDDADLAKLRSDPRFAQLLARTR